MPEPKQRLMERLFEAHRTALQAFFVRRVRTRQDAVDLVQEVYLRMLRVKDTDALHNPEGYLFTVAANLVHEQSLRESRRPTPAQADEAFLRADLEGARGMEESLDAQLRCARLREVLAQLPPKCRATVYMKYQHGLSYEEIAQQLGVSTHMVQKYLGTALAHCRRRMARLK
jgi:RNA polymerase sigma factor (sigma-70 family)